MSRSEAAKKAWETIRKRRAQGFYQKQKFYTDDQKRVRPITPRKYQPILPASLSKRVEKATINKSAETLIPNIDKELNRFFENLGDTNNANYLNNVLLSIIRNVLKTEDVDRIFDAYKVFRYWAKATYLDGSMSPIWVYAQKKTGLPIHPKVNVVAPTKDQMKVIDVISQLSRQIIKKKYGNKKIAVYKGVEDGERLKRGSKIKYRQPYALDSWTPDKRLAERFANMRKGVVLKAEVHPDDIGFLGSLAIPMATWGWEGNEFTLMTTRELEAEVL